MNIRYVTKQSDLNTNIADIDEFILMNDLTSGLDIVSRSIYQSGFRGYKGGVIINLNNYSINASGYIGLNAVDNSTGVGIGNYVIFINGTLKINNYISLVNCLFYNCRLTYNPKFYGIDNGNYRNIILNSIIEFNTNSGLSISGTSTNPSGYYTTRIFNSIITIDCNKSISYSGGTQAPNCELIYGIIAKSYSQDTPNFLSYAYVYGMPMYNNRHSYTCGDSSYSMYKNTKIRKDYWKTGFVKGQKFIVKEGDVGFITQTVDTIRSKLGLINLFNTYKESLLTEINNGTSVIEVLKKSLRELNTDTDYFILSNDTYEYTDLSIYKDFYKIIEDVNNRGDMLVTSDTFNNDEYNINDYKYIKQIVNVGTEEVSVQYFSKIDLLTTVNENIFISKVNISN